MMKLQAPSLALHTRLRASGYHLLICIAVAALAATLVFVVWYPWPYRVISGGQDLFTLITAVDLVLGPLLTFAIFDIKKGWPHLRRDLTVIAFLQLTALAYGLHKVYEARPVAMVFETDRFRVVTAGEVYRVELPLAPPRYRELPLAGPWLLGARPTQRGEERNDALFMGLKGVDIGERPRFWQDYSLSKRAALERSRPVTLLLQQYPQKAGAIHEALSKAKLDQNEARFLPLMARREWVVLLNPDGDIAGYVPIEGFF